MGVRTVEVDYLTRVEGETAIRVRVPERGTPDIELRIFEPPRFFEGFLVGRRYDEVGDVVARICGICPVSHMTTAIRAVEKATGIEPSAQTRALRRIASAAQIAASHLVHLVALVLPDHADCAGLPELVERRPAEVDRLVRLRAAVNDLTATVGGGRALHPVGLVPGGFTRVPTAEQLGAIRERLISLRPDVEALTEMVATLAVPDLRRARTFLALAGGEDGDGRAWASFNRGVVRSSGGLRVDEDRYEEAIEEVQVPHAMALRLRLRGGEAPMVGALARLNLGHERLPPRVRDLAGHVGLAPPEPNPYRNNLAQAVEIAHCFELCIDEIAELAPRPEEPARPTRGGRGAALTEAPRGLLYHAYEVDRRGVVRHARIITPTVHNFACLEDDLRALVAQQLEAGAGDAELRRRCEMLVRAYDPCFSCSVH